jgi:hypothetical protein
VSARNANHLAVVVDAQRLVVVVSRTGERGEFDHHSIFGQYSVFESLFGQRSLQFVLPEFFAPRWE